MPLGLALLFSNCFRVYPELRQKIKKMESEILKLQKENARLEKELQHLRTEIENRNHENTTRRKKLSWTGNRSPR